MPTPQDLEAVFRSLNIDSSVDGAVQAQTLLADSLFVAVNTDGDFLCLVNDKREIASPPRRLRVISVDYGLKYKANVEGVEMSGTFTVLKLKALNEHLLLSFCSLLSLLSSSLGDHPTPQELQSFVEDFIELFAPKAGDPRERLKGLFGELAFIGAAAKPSSYVLAWHESTNANKDFSFAKCFVEVKTTEGKVRKHDFAASQLQSPFDGKPVFIASVILEEDPQGKSVFQILESLQVGLEHKLQVKLIKLVFDTIGLDAEDAHEIKWVVAGGDQGIWVFEARDLPSPTVDEHKRAASAISNVSFSLNIEILTAAGIEHVLVAKAEQGF